MYIKVRQVKSKIGQSKAQIKVLEGLGLGRIGASKLHKDNNCIRGMINKVVHLVEYELVSK